MASTVRSRRRRQLCGAFILLLAFTGSCRSCSEQGHRGRADPVCAVQDCATGKTIDDGCADDGRCLSCINACPPAAVPIGRP